jgi:homoserine O-acetyltransferase
MIRIAAAALTLAAASAFAPSAGAYEPLVEKQVFETRDFQTFGGETIPELRLGWEAYGELNEARDNVILITHFYTGNSHAAGRYTEEGPRGYWDEIIGSGKPIDTDRFYVVSVDSLANLGAGDPNVVTTGPASIDPRTGEPYGLDFPVITIRDFVEAQKLVLDSLGVERLHAVMGASMGGLQAYEWAAAYPDRVDRVIPVIAAGWATGDLIGWLDMWSTPIRVDANWNGGDYYGGEPPAAGLAAALKLVTLHAQHWEWSNSVFGRQPAEGADPLDSLGDRFAIEAALDAVGEARAATADANHFLYLARANQLFSTGHGDSPQEGLRAIEAPVMIIYTDEDLIFPEAAILETAAVIASDGTPATLVELAGSRGHLDGVLSIAQAGDAIRAFLEE